MDSQRIAADSFQPVQSRRTVEDVVGQILAKIRVGDIQEGDFLPAERQLATSMEVSRRTIRAAAATLTDAGVIEVLPGATGGMRVISRWTPEGLGERSELPADEIFQMLEARRTLEPRIAQMAAMRGTDTDFEAMRSAIELQTTVLDDHARVIQANSMFHRAMWRAAKNAILEEAMSSIYGRLEIALDMTSRTSGDTTTSLRLHEETLRAVMRGDLDEVDEVMDRHLSYLEEICEDVLGRPQVRPRADFLIPSRAASRSAGISAKK